MKTERKTASTRILIGSKIPTHQTPKKPDKSSSTKSKGSSNEKSANPGSGKYQTSLDENSRTAIQGRNSSVILGQDMETGQLVALKTIIRLGHATREIRAHMHCALQNISGVVHPLEIFLNSNKQWVMVFPRMEPIPWSALQFHQVSEVIHGLLKVTFMTYYC